jgi:hypothetical protein
MNLRRLLCAWFVAGAVSAGAADEFFDRLEERLTWSAREGGARARISGTLDVEAYFLPQPAPGLIDATDHALFNPRLSVFFDAQLGPPIYIFAQARADRGFDPTGERVHARLDEYAIRLTPWRDARLNLQVGKFGTVVGNWVARHTSWANPFITAPLPYEYLTGVWDTEALRSTTTLLQWSHVRPGLPAFVTAREKSFRIPVLWGPSYALGAAVSGEFRRLQYSFEVKHAALSSRPSAWHHAGGWAHPTVSGRLGYRPNPAWNVGVSASTGTYLQPSADRSVPSRRSFGDYRQVVLGQDVSFAWHHWQVWTEIYAARFEIPAVADAETLAYYAEARYKFTPQFSAALRWNQQLFGRVLERGAKTRWGHDAWRIDLAPMYRFTPHVQVKLQYSLQQGDTAPRRAAHVLSLQTTVRF